MPGLGIAQARKDAPLCDVVRLRKAHLLYLNSLKNIDKKVRFINLKGRGKSFPLSGVWGETPRI